MLHGRLPTEAQWERAARGGDGRVFVWGDQDPDHTRLNGCSAECVQWHADQGLPPVEPMFAATDRFPSTAPAGSFPAGRSQAGAHDMIGNVAEWTLDAFVPYGAAAPPSMAEPRRRSVRGGSFMNTVVALADPASREGLREDLRRPDVGFRCVVPGQSAAP